MPKSGASSDRHRTQASSVYPTPPLSSAPSSSQSGTQNARKYESVYSSSYAPADNHHTQAERESWLADDEEEDYSETISSTQTGAADTEQLVLHGDLSTKIVGVQYYRGHANPSE